MGFSGGISRLSELIVDLFRTGEPGSRRLEITTEQEAQPDDRHQIKFYEEQPYEDTPAQIFSYMSPDSDPTSEGRQRMQISSAKSLGLSPTAPHPTGSLLLMSDLVKRAPGVPTVPDTTARLDSHRTVISGGQDTAGEVAITARTIKLQGTYVDRATECFIAVVNGGGQAVGHGGWVRLNLETLASSTPGWGFDAVNKVWYVPRTGWYDINLRVGWAQDGYGGNRGASLRFNGAGLTGWWPLMAMRQDWTTATGTGTNYPWNNIRDIVYLPAGTVCWGEIYAWTAGGIVTSVLTGHDLTMTMRRIYS